MAKIVTLKDNIANESVYPQTKAEATFMPSGENIQSKVENLSLSFGANVFSNGEIMVGYVINSDTEIVWWDNPIYGVVKMHLTAGTYKIILPCQGASTRAGLAKFSDSTFSGQGTVILPGQSAEGNRVIIRDLEEGYYAMHWKDEEGISINSAGAAILKVTNEAVSEKVSLYNIMPVTSKEIADKLIKQGDTAFTVIDGYATSWDGQQEEFIFTKDANYVTLVIKYDGKSKYLRCSDLVPAHTAWHAHMKEWGVWEYSNFLGGRRTDAGQVDLTTLSGLGYIAISYLKADQAVDLDPEKCVATWSSDGNEEITSTDYTRTEVEKESIVYGKFLISDGTEKANAKMNYVTYSVSDDKKYAVSGFGYPSAGYAMIWEIHFFSGETYLGWQYYIDHGPMEQTDDYLILELPVGCDTIAVNVQNNYLDQVKLFEVATGQPISLKDLQDRVTDLEANSGNIDGTAANVIIKQGRHIYARTALNDTQDIVVDYYLWDNNNYTWNNTYIGAKDNSLDDMLEAGYVHQMGDSTGAFGITDPAPWHLWAQHGYCIPVLNVASHALTSDDIGSVWRDQRDRRYTIGNFDVTHIYLLPEIYETEFPDVYTRSWKSPTSGNHPEITSLEHVSGATHTSTIIPLSSSHTQLRPMMTLKKRTLLADGIEVTEDGTYKCNEFIISETLNCTNPWTVETWWPVTQVDIGAELTQNFTICGLGHRFDVILNMKKPYLFSWYGANQIQHLVPIEQMEGYDVYGLMPRVKSFDYPYLVNDLTRSGEGAYNNSTSLYDTNKHPDRYITFFKNEQGDMPLGCASGLSIVRGTSKDSNRASLADPNELLLSISPANRNKAYFRLIHPSKFENGVLPASFICNISTYLCYFDPNANAGQVYWYKDGNAYMVYAHYQTAQDKTAIMVAPQMEGLSVEVIDKTPGVTLLTEIVDNQNIYVSADGANNNYIVMRLS